MEEYASLDRYGNWILITSNHPRISVGFYFPDCYYYSAPLRMAVKASLLEELTQRNLKGTVQFITSYTSGVVREYEFHINGAQITLNELNRIVVMAICSHLAHGHLDGYVQGRHFILWRFVPDD